MRLIAYKSYLYAVNYNAQFNRMTKYQILNNHSVFGLKYIKLILVMYLLQF